MDGILPAPCVAVIADIVGSRTATDRAALQQRVLTALEHANTLHAPLHPFAATVGDEFQGVFATTGHALAAAWTTRLTLGDDADLRFGIGRGEARVLNDGSPIQDGSAWWAARAALDAIERRARGGRHMLRIGLDAAPDAPAITSELRAAVALADALHARLDQADRTILIALRDGGTQADAAHALRISRSAVSQRVARGGLAILADTLSSLGDIA